MDGNTALMYACVVKNRYGLARCLKSDKEQPNYQGNTALMCCAVSGFSEGAEKLVKFESGMTNDYGQTALMIAAAQGYADVVRILLETEQGMTDKAHRTAAMYAAYGGNPECLELLVNEQPQVDANDNPVLFYCINALDRVKEIEDSREKASFSEKCMRCINLVWDKQKELVNKDQQTALMLCAGHNLMYQVKELAPSQMGR